MHTIDYATEHNNDHGHIIVGIVIIANNYIMVCYKISLICYDITCYSVCVIITNLVLVF